MFALALINHECCLLAQSPSQTIIISSPDKLIDQSMKKFGQKNFIGALEDLNQAIKVNPKYAKSYNGRGVVKTALKDWKGAMIDYNKAIALDPKFARAYSNRGSLKVYQNDFNSASKDFDSALSLDSNLAEAYYNRAVMLGKLGKKDAGIKDIEKAAQLYESQGDKDSARQMQEIIKRFNQIGRASCRERV